MSLRILVCSFNIEDYVGCIADELLLEVWPPWPKIEVHEGLIRKEVKHKVYLKDMDSEQFIEASWGIHVYKKKGPTLVTRVEKPGSSPN